MDPRGRRVLAILGIISLAVVARVWGIDSESFWVDEAFTAWASDGSVAEILERNARDIHPPAYYLGLSLWRDLIPDSDAAIRAYSALWSVAGVLVLMLFADALVGWRGAWIAGLLAAVNPLDIYFAQEARMYAQSTTLVVASAWCLWGWLRASRRPAPHSRAWPWALAYALLAIASLLTHYLVVTLLIGQGLVALAYFAWRRDWKSAAGYAAVACVVALAFTPWLAYVLSFRETVVRAEGLDWMPVPVWSDYFSFLGREFFWGRARKIHDAWWLLTLALPLAVMAGGWWSAQGTRRRDSDGKGLALLYLAGLIAASLVVTAVVGSTYQVIYFRPRYSVLLLPYFLVILAAACGAMRNPTWMRASVVACAGLMLLGTVAQQSTPQKRAWRETAESWPESAPSFYVILPVQHQRPLSYYLGGRVRHTPREVLERLAPLPEGAHIWVATWPEGPGPGGKEYLEWLEGVGDARHMVLPSYYSITQVEPAGGDRWPEHASRRFRNWYPPFDVSGGIAGFSNATRFEELAFDGEGQPYRWSGDRAWLRLDGVAEGEEVVIHAALPETGAAPGFHLLRGPDPRTLFESASPDSGLSPETKEIRLSVPPGSGPLWIGWSRPRIAARDVDASEDRVLRVDWIGVEAQRHAGAPGQRDRTANANSLGR
jgi:4-amino-4-deoxy-L-arabinose transferase-like glycosyltransferase